MFNPVVSSGPPPFVDVWAGKVASVTTLVSGLSQPNDVVALPSGNIVVSDSSNKRIALITPEGVVSTLAGGTTLGFLDGTGAAAKFNNPKGLVALPNGNIVVSDASNMRIRLVTPEGVVSTLAGQTTGGHLDGTGAAAKFSSPQKVAVLPNGNIVVADASNNRVRLVTPEGVVSTFAGQSTGSWLDGTGAAAQFNSPEGVAVLPNGNIVVADAANHRIRLITPAGVVSTLAGQTAPGNTNGIGAVAQFNYPNAVSVLPNGNIVVVDGTNNSIRLLTPT